MKFNFCNGVIPFAFALLRYLLKRPEHGVHIAGRVVIHHSKHDGVHECNHVLGTVGWDAQQHIGGEHKKEENEIQQTGNVDHCG